MAQTTKPELALVARGYPDRVILRYFPTSPALMTRAGAAGFVIERANFKQGTAVEKLTYSAIKGSPFKRWDEAAWTSGLQGIAPGDTTSRQIAGLAMALNDPNVKTAGSDVLADGLKTLMDERNQQDMKFAMALIAANRSSIAAEGLALRVTDQNVKSGASYVYRVRIASSPAAGKNAAAYVKVTCTAFNPRYLLNNKAVKVIEGDTRVTLSFPLSEAYYAFSVERSDDGGASYKRITGGPELKVTPKGATPAGYGFVDSNLTNYKKYMYRVLVATPYADELLLAEFTAMPRDRTPPPAPFLKSAMNNKPKQVELVWEATEVADLKGFAIQRGTSINGKFTLISKTLLPKTARSYIDEGFDPYGNNYYAVEAVDTAGNVSFSFPTLATIIDSIPPAAPVIASATIDTAGKVLIKIKPNTEKDFIGYQVLKANAPDHEFSVVTETYMDSLGKKRFSLRDSTTLNSLTHHIYYKVIAFDSHYNQSPPSKIIELKRRDTIPPVSPLITGVVVTDSTVAIKFVNSPSDDAVSNILLRREPGKSRFDTVLVNRNPAVTAFTDKKVSGGKQYEYAMIAKDESKLSSKISRSIVVSTPVNKRLPVPKISGSYNADTKKIPLNFVIDDRIKNRKLKIALYKRPDKQASWVAYKLIIFEPGKPFVDDAGGAGSEFYAAKVLDDQDNSSNLSDELEINIR
jgi:fibronectin type 3 domain-containing protein